MKQCVSIPDSMFAVAKFAMKDKVPSGSPSAIIQEALAEYISNHWADAEGMIFELVKNTDPGDLLDALFIVKNSKK